MKPSPGVVFRCLLHWELTWMNRRIQAAHAQVMMEVHLLNEMANHVPDELAEFVRHLAQGMSYEASWLAWYGRAE